MPPPKLTPAEWRAVQRRVLTRALELRKSVPKARELMAATLAKAFEPDTTPWDPAGTMSFEAYLCDIAWSLHGNEKKSYRVTRASERLEDAPDEAVPSSRDPVKTRERSLFVLRAERRRAALRQKAAGDALVLELLEVEQDQGDAQDEARSDSPGDELPGDDVPAVDGEKARAPATSRLPASTRRALAKGYTEKDVKNARERLKRYALAVAREEEKE